MGRASPEQVSRHAVWLALARGASGAPALAAPDARVRLLGLSRRGRERPHRFFTGFFGVRELLLGGFLVAARRDRRRLAQTAAFAALADLGDAGLVLRELRRRDTVEPGVALLLLSALAGCGVSTALWWEVSLREPAPAT